METSPAVGGPLLEEVAEGIFAYLATRSKWHKALTNLKPNALVLLVDDNIPGGRWNLGRILDTYPGPDGLVRVAKVKTKEA